MRPLRPPPFRLLGDKRLASRGGSYRPNVIEDACSHLHLCMAVPQVDLRQVRMAEPGFSGRGWAGTDRGSGAHKYPSPTRFLNVMVELSI